MLQVILLDGEDGLHIGKVALSMLIK